uniref:IS3 family transposase n=1 Tax=Paenibacillus sp. FSL H7-0350 TaxID=2975345 RepID=UPI00406C9EEF
MGNLNRTLFTEDIIRRLEKNPNVQRVSETNISYTAEFKLAAVKAYNEGTPPSEIFLRAGFDLDLIGSKKPKHSLKRWRDSFAKYGELGLLEERRGKGSAGRKPASPLSADEELKRAKAKIKLLEAEVGLSKKARSARTEQRKTLTPSERYEIIHYTLRAHGLSRMTRYLCEVAAVSTSGYYRWLGSEQRRQLRTADDERDLVLIKQHFDALQGRAGALVIKMRLEHLSGVTMNHKKIRRLMRKFNLVAAIRQANPYRKMAKATQEHQTCANLLKRQFDQNEPEKVFLTDITYLRYGNGQWAYLSCIKDGATRQILADCVAGTLELPLVEKTIRRLLERLDGNLHPEAIFHSDQGMHYTHPKTRLLIEQAGFQQSMSRKGNCWDNASMESFFGHMKDEMSVRDCQNLTEVRARVSEYIAYYNSERYQWTLKKMTPDEFRSHLLAS